MVNLVVLACVLQATTKKKVVNFFDEKCTAMLLHFKPRMRGVQMSHHYVLL